MAEGKSNPLMYVRLQIAYALEFAIWGCWSYALGSFCGKYNVDQGLLYSAFALGALFAPLVGPIADKKFAAQKVFAFMQLICGAALLYCGVLTKQIANAGPYDTVTAPTGLWIGMMFVAGLMFMPSIPLLNAIVFKHIPDDKKSPFVFIFGTIGWIVINLILAKLEVEKFYFIDACVAFALAIYALTLPNTPPSGNKNNDPFGFKALGLFKRFDFTLFMVCATLVGIFGSNYYFAFVGDCFPNKGVYNQYSEIIFMAALAFAVAKIGLKWTLTLGMAAWGVRYLCFAQGGDGLALVGLLCHGLAYAFLYTAAYMYGDRVAPKEMKASVQALIAFLLLGVAQTLSGVAVSVEKKNNEITPDSVSAVVYVIETSAYAQDGSIDAAEAAAEVAQEATDAVAEAAQEATDSAAEVVQETTDAVVEVAQEATDAAAEAAQETADAAAEAAQEATDAVVEVAQEATDAVAEAAEDASGAVSGVIDTATDVVSDAAEAVNDSIEDATGVVANAVAPEAAASTGFKVWDKTVWAKYNWKKIWGGPAVFCLIFALIFALFGKEPKNADEEETKE